MKARKKRDREAEMGLVAVVGNKELGRELLAAAQESYREAIQKQVVNRVQEFVIQLEKQRRYRTSCLANIALLERKLAAIHAGAFVFSTYGNELTFTDPALQNGLVTMAECVNCGAPARRS